jgi:hypothetical protein
MLSENLACAKRSREVRVQYVFPFLFKKLESGNPLDLCRTVNENIDPAKSLQGCDRELFERSAIANITGLPKRLPPKRLNFYGNFVDFLRAPGGGDNISPRLSKTKAQRAPDS